MKSRRIRPIKAYKHFRKLIADKEDTIQVFHIIEALDGNNLTRDFKKFMKTAKGQAQFKAQRKLVPLLDDHEALRKLPLGSVGQHYCDFMETQNLTAQGLVDEYDRFGKRLEDYYPADVAWYGNRRRDVHDLIHVLTGYSRDALGEASVLNFTFSQQGGFGLYFIAHMAAIQMLKSTPKGLPVWGAVREAKANGKLAHSIIQEDISALLSQPLDQVRQSLGIRPATQYQIVHEGLAEAGIDPFGVIEAQAA